MKRCALLGFCLMIALLGMVCVSAQDVEPAVEPAPQMDALPTDCGILAMSISPDPGIPHAIGTSPLWIGLTDGVLPMPTEHYQDNPQLPGWWSTKVGWLIPRTYTGTVQVRGWNVTDDSPIYFEFGDDGALTVATLNPDVPGGFVDGLEAWAFFPSYVWVSKAGCYRLHAEWEGGLWEQVIAVGSME